MKLVRLIPMCLAALVLAGCENAKPTSDFPDRDAEKKYRYGALGGGEPGISILGGNEDDKAKPGAGIGVNGYLWRASLDTVSFLPIASADPFGGVILTDWYSPEGAPNERFKVNVTILDTQLRADGVRVAVFRQTRGGDAATWQDAPVSRDTGRELENTILTRARELRIAQNAGK